MNILNFNHLVQTIQQVHISFQEQSVKPFNIGLTIPTPAVKDLTRGGL